ncbi:hypothetical protein JB92DRAFT_3094242 [Gautieria morchelliformis]|nr:hypothetical protein JB92DRAFT_3094242 [Gautieria morchelliformis]
MAAFKVPSMVAPDLAIIMGLLDPPEATPPMRGTGDSARGHKRKGSPSIISRAAIDPDSDIASSCTESEDEVEAQIAVSLRTNGAALTNSILSSVKPPPSDEEVSDSDSDSSNSASSSAGPFRRQKRKTEQTLPSGISNEDGMGLLTAAIYIPTAHELPLTAIPVPSLPDPSALPQEALEFVGEIITVLPDSVTVRGGALSTYSARERRDLVLDEGSLLLLDDRTPLGYVWETFGPTTLPHYLVRVQRRESTRDLTTTPHTPIDAQPVQDQAVPENETNLRSSPTLSLSSTPQNYFDPTKIFVTRAIFHIPSLSKFFFPSALAGLKGSDASNLYDEEPPENELDFSDDEAEAAHKRLRRGSFPQEPSQTRSSGTFNDEADDSMSVVGDDATSLYGTSPYDFEDIRSPGREEHSAPSSPGGSTAPSQSLVSFEDANTQKALMLARNSRHRRHGSLSISEQSSTAGPSQFRGQIDQPPARGRRRGRGRGKDRGREPSFTAHSRGGGRRRGRGVDLERHDRGHIPSRNQGSSYSFEEYDPHMPRPPSPTSIAIARATGQWADGTPFPYNSGAASGGRAISPDGHTGQTTSNVQGHMPMHYPTGPYRQEYFDPSLSFSQPLDYGPMQLGSYGVAPHINPRFAQAIQLPMSVQTSSVPPPSTAVPPGSLSTAYSHPKSEEASDTVPGLQLDD